MSYHLGIDIGATNTRCLITTDTFETVVDHRRETPQGPTVEAFTDGIQTVIRETLAGGGLDPAQIATVGIASFGPLAVERGLISATPNLDVDLSEIPVREAVASVFPTGTPVRLLNDATAGVVAESRATGTDGTIENTHDSPEENVVYVTLSSGVGGGAVVDGRLLRGRNGNATEVGHFTLDPGTQVTCGCGATGHWEAFASGENIPAYASFLQESEHLDSALDPPNCTSKALFEAYGDDPLATELIDRIGTWNTLGMATLTQAFAPGRIAVGGSVALENESLILDPIRNQIDDHLMIETPEIQLTEFGDAVVVTGAVLYALDQSMEPTQ